MKKLCIIISIMVFSSLGWWLGKYLGDAPAYILSGIGSLIGVYVGWRIHRDYLDL